MSFRPRSTFPSICTLSAACNSLQTSHLHRTRKRAARGSSASPYTARARRSDAPGPALMPLSRNRTQKRRLAQSLVPVPVPMLALGQQSRAGNRGSVSSERDVASAIPHGCIPHAATVRDSRCCARSRASLSRSLRTGWRLVGPWVRRPWVRKRSLSYGQARRQNGELLTYNRRFK